MRWLAVVATVGLLLAAGAPARSAAPVSTSHGLSMYGDLKYPAGFRHFDYVDPDAPVGGDVKLSALGTFDNLNPFVLKGVAAAGSADVFDTLMAQSADEPFSEYGLIAESAEMPADRSWVTFTLRPQARFHDGSPITADDVIWTFETLRTKGHPFYRTYYGQVARVEKVGERRVKFTFRRGDNRELPLIVGQMPVLSRAWWAGRAFDHTTLEPPLASGAYRVVAVEPGRSIVYRRVPDYWAARLPVNVGRNNFGTIRYDYYRDSTVALEAFKAGEYDFREENAAKNWARAYDTPAAHDGRIRKETIPNQLPAGMQGFVFNTRRPLFQDRRVRWALAHAFDFEWTNAHLFYGAYTRTRSYWANSALASRGLPSPAERAILAPFADRLAPEVLTREYVPPTTDGSGFPRENLLAALALLRDAGWVVRDGRLVSRTTGAPFTFEILLVDSGFERVVLPFAKNLARLGIDARVRTVDSAQYQYRLDHFDFDMTTFVWGESLSPGNEQVDYWTSERADVPGSRNMAGIHDPVVDRLVALVVAAPDRQSLVDRTHALDRVLLWGHYVIPQWHIGVFRVAYWDKFGRPARPPKYALGLDTWWVDPAKAGALSRTAERRK